MKKVIFGVVCGIVAVALITVVVIFGLQLNDTPTAPSDTDVPTTTQPGTTATIPTTAPIEINISTPMVSISLPVIEETDVADDGTVIFRRTFQDVVLSIEDAEMAKTVILDLLQRMDNNSSVLSSIQSSAYSDYTGQSLWIAYYYEILYNPTRIDQTVLSLYGVEDTYGGMQSGINGTSVNYDLRTGSALTLSDVLTEESAAVEQLCTALLAALAEKQEDYMLFDDYADTITNRFQSDLQKDNSWYFSNDGLCFFFAPYDIAPNSSGIVTATVPYSELTGILQDSYLPDASEVYPGDLTGTAFENADLDKFTHFSELVTDPDASRYVFQTNGVLYDLQVIQGHWASETRFTEDAVVFTANLMKPTDAFILRSELPEDQGTLLVSYRRDGTEYRFYITLDSTTGTPVLTAVE